LDITAKTQLTCSSDEGSDISFFATDFVAMAPRAAQISTEKDSKKIRVNPC
jgi:hypothetical protein